MITVVKVGGSLYDLPELGDRLRHWLDRQTGSLVLIPGGGSTADLVRRFDRQHRLGEDQAHWLALRALSLNAHVLACLVPATQVIEDFREVNHSWAERKIPILDMFAFAWEDDQEADHPPHDWNTTSDSLALRLAWRLGADRLVLLKSVSIPGSVTWEQASKDGWVDGHFPTLAAKIGRILTIEMINFRDTNS